MSEKKITCIGAGSLYFMWMMPEFMLCKGLDGSEIVMYDIDAEKAERMAELGKRLAEEAGTKYKFRSTADLSDAVDGADFAVSSIGGSGAEITKNVYGSYYHNADVRIPAKYGIYQVVGDTCGPAGMMMGLRSIPAYLKICREMEKRCPGVILFNHSNPMAVLCRAMHKYSDINVIGICHGVQGGIGYASEILGVPANELECVWIGTNHYYWFTRILHKGKDVYPELKKKMAKRVPDKGRIMSAQLSRIYNYHIVYPQDDHIIEFYPFSAQVAGGFKDLPYGMNEEYEKHWKGDGEIRKPTQKASPKVRRKFFAQYQKMLDGVKMPEKKEDTTSGEEVPAVMSAIAHGQRKICIVNVANKGAVSNLPDTAEVELEGVTDSKGVRPIHIGTAPIVLKGILEKRFVWHELVADSAVKGDRNLALQALLIDEMAILPEKAEQMLDEMLTISKDMLPQFFKR